MKTKMQALADIALRTNELAVTLTQVILPLVESAMADGKLGDSKELRDGIESLRVLYKKSEADMRETRKYFGLQP